MSQEEADSAPSKEKRHPPKKDVEKPQEDPVARGIAVGSALLGIYVLDKLLGDDWYEVDDEGNVTHKQKGLIEELLE